MRKNHLVRMPFRDVALTTLSTPTLYLSTPLTVYLSVHTAHSAPVHTAHSAPVNTAHSTLYTCPHCSLYTLHLSTLLTLHSTPVHTHSTLYTCPHPLYTLYLSTPPTPHSTPVHTTLSTHTYLSVGIGISKDGSPVFLREIWPKRSEIQEVERQFVLPAMFREVYEKITVSLAYFHLLVCIVFY